MHLIVYISDEKAAWSGDKYLSALKVGGLTLAQRILRAAQPHVQKFSVLLPADYPWFDDALISKGIDLIRYDKAGKLDSHGLTDWAENERLIFATANAMLSREFFKDRGEGSYQVSRNNELTGVYYLDSSALKGIETIEQYVKIVADIENTEEYEAGLFHVIAEKSDMKKALKLLSRSLKKRLAREADGLVAYFINRPMSLQISKVLANTFVTPNMITAFGLFLGLLGAYLVSKGEYWYVAAGAVLWQTSSMVDGVDGELARMRMSPSHLGEWFDTVSDDIINISFLVGLGYGLMRVNHEPLYYHASLVVAAIVTCSVLWFYYEFIKRGIASHNNYEWGFERKSKEESPSDSFYAKLKKLSATIASGFAWIAKRDFYTFLIMVLLVLGLFKVSYYTMLFGTALVGVGGLLQQFIALLRGKLKS